MTTAKRGKAHATNASRKRDPFAVVGEAIAAAEAVKKATFDPRTPMKALPAMRRRASRTSPLRLDPTLKAGLTVLAQALKEPLNRLVNEAVREFIERRSGEVDADVERILARLKARRETDPDFETAIAKFVDAEAALAQHDPMEGRSRHAGGPAQTMVRELLRG